MYVRERFEHPYKECFVLLSLTCVTSQNGQYLLAVGFDRYIIAKLGYSMTKNERSSQSELHNIL